MQLRVIVSIIIYKFVQLIIWVNPFPSSPTSDGEYYLLID